MTRMFNIYFRSAHKLFFRRIYFCLPDAENIVFIQQFIRHKQADIAENHIHIAITPKIIFLVYRYKASDWVLQGRQDLCC